jgi:membrane protein implicated in regulation of membrane protease activity
MLLQVPGWLIGALLLYGAYLQDYISANVALALFGAWVVLEVLLYPVMRIAYEVSDPDPAAALLGRVGVVARAVDPPGPGGSGADGYVRLGPELWRARSSPECDSMPPGARVTVRGVEGLVLTVSPTTESDTD